MVGGLQKCRDELNLYIFTLLHPLRHKMTIRIVLCASKKIMECRWLSNRFSGVKDGKLH